MESFDTLRVFSSSVEARVLIDLVFCFFRVIASSPNRSLNGVKTVHLEIVVLWFHTTFINSSDHFTFGILKSDLIIPVMIIPFARSSRPLDSRCLTDVKCIFVPNWSRKVLKASDSNCTLLSTMIAFETPKRQITFCQKNF